MAQVAHRRVLEACCCALSRRLRAGKATTLQRFCTTPADEQMSIEKHDAVSQRTGSRPRLQTCCVVANRSTANADGTKRHQHDLMNEAV